MVSLIYNNILHMSGVFSMRRTRFLNPFLRTHQKRLQE